MTAKEELLEYYHKKNDGKKILEQYKDYLDRATKMTAMMSETSARTNLPSDKVGNNVVLMADLSLKYFDLFLQAEEHKVSIISKLIKLEQPYKDILWQRFIDEHSWNEIASVVPYSRSQIKRIYKQALNEFEKMNQNEPK